MLDPETNAKIENRAVRRLVLYILSIILTSTVMLAINTGLIFSLARGIVSLFPEWNGLQQFVQFVIFLGPVVLLYLEWYVWDVISARQIRLRNS